MAKQRPYDVSEFTTPHEAQQAENESVREAASYDAFGDTETFTVRVLSQPIPMSANDFRAVMGAMGELGDDPSALGADSTARIIFVGRIEASGTPSPHVTLPDPCDPAILGRYHSSNRVVCASKIVSWHTKFISKDNFQGVPPKVGDRVKITILPGDFKYNLQFAYFDSLESAVEEIKASEDCKELRDLFSTFRVSSLGEILPTPEVAPGTKGGSGAPVSRPAGTEWEKACSGETPVSDVDFSSVVSAKPGIDGSASRGEGRGSMKFQRFTDGSGSMTNFRSQQPTLGAIKWFHEQGVRTILKYNKNTKIFYDKNVKTKSGAQGVCIGGAVTKAFCESLVPPIKHIRMSAHKGPKVGRGYTTSIASADPYLRAGHTMVHCTHGADRTGAILGAWLWSMRGTVKTLPGDTKPISRERLWKYANDFADWNSKICAGEVGTSADNQGYAWYLDGFYPFASWCKQGNRATSCRSCRRINKGHGRLPPLGSAAPAPPEPPAKTEKEKCEETPGWTWYDDGTPAGTGCWEDA